MVMWWKMKGKRMKDTDSNESSIRAKTKRELFIIVGIAIVVYIISGAYDIEEALTVFLQRYEAYEVDELLIVAIAMSFCMSVFAFRRWQDIRTVNKKLKTTNSDLESALSEVKELRGIIPICSICKKIRDSEGYWQAVEKYIMKKTDAKFSHGYCDECMEKADKEIDDLDIPEPDSV